MNSKIVFTPGPTYVKENVRLARAESTTNPDLDLDFYDFYRESCNNLSDIMNTKNQVRILSGEGILGLEAACASLTEDEDRVLVIDNGLFGEGFADFVKMYGGEPVFFKGNRDEDINIANLKAFLEKDNNFKYATVVHCDTPSGVLNDISKICPLLKSYGILTVVDTVAAMIAVELKVDSWQIDIALGGSQKALSAPAGLTFLSISEDAFKAMENRKKPISSYYCNLLIWKNYYENKWFPYTMPISDIMGLRVAIDNVLEEGVEEVIVRHTIIAEATRLAIEEAGLKLHIKKGYSNTVTVFDVPQNVDCEELLSYIKEKHNLLLASSFGYLKNKVIRLGHMGENAKASKVLFVLNVLQDGLLHFGVELKCNLSQIFFEKVKK